MKKLICMVSVAVLTAVDQIIKFFVERDLKPVKELPFIDGFICWRYVRNTGAAFGSFSNSTVFLSVFTAVLLAVGIAALLAGKIKDKFYQVCAVMVISGGLGNLIDRVFRGFVIDYIEVQFTDFAVFNFADILVTCGAFMIMGYTVYDIIKEQKSKKKGDENG